MTDKLQKVIGDEIISDSIIDREKFSLAGETPTIVIFPTAIAHISKIMTFANRERIKILISGNNSQHYFGSAIETPDWCISLNRLNKIIEHEVVDLIITVEAGVTLSQLQKFLTVYRQFLPLDPINTNQRTLGGIVATNSAGPLRLQYGSCRDLILGLKVVLPDGTIIRTGGKTVKNVAGYDLSKLFIGSMGTLGVITEITFKLSPRSTQSQTLWADFNQFNTIPDLINLICSSNLVISRCEYLNKFFVDENLGDNYRRNAPHNLLLNVQGHPEMVETTIEKLRQLISEKRGKNIRCIAETDEIELWNRITNSYSDNGKSQFGLHCQLSVPKSYFGQVLSALEKYSIENNFSIAIHTHAGNGIINIFWGNLDEEGTESDVLRTQLALFRQVAQDYHGNMVVHQAPNYLRAPEQIWGKPNKDFRLIKAIKSKYDAQQVLVSGRFIGGI